MQACPFQLRLVAGAKTSLPQLEDVATRVVAQMRHATRDHPAIRHITVLPGGSPMCIEGVAFVVGEEEDVLRIVARLLDAVLARVPGAGDLFERGAPPAPAVAAETAAMAASGQSGAIDQWPGS